MEYIDNIRNIISGSSHKLTNLTDTKILEIGKRIDEKTKIYNYSNGGSTNWFNFAKKILFLYGSNKIIEPVDSEYLKDVVKRPKFSITSKQKIIDTFNLKINNWDKSLANFISNDLK